MNSWETLEQDALSTSDISVDRCKFGRYLESLGTNARYVREALENRDISAQALYRALVARGMSCGLTALKMHKNRECTCFKENT